MKRISHTFDEVRWLVTGFDKAGNAAPPRVEHPAVLDLVN